MFRSLAFLVVSYCLIACSVSPAEAYTYHWEIDETPQGAESATLIEPIQVVLLDEVVEVASHSASLQLREKYSVHLGTEWSAQHAYSLLRTFESIPQAVNYPYDEEPTVPASVWTLSDRHIQNDIAVKMRDGKRQVTVAKAAFTYAEPLLAKIDGVRGRFFSQRLHRAVVRFVTDNGADRYALERILQERYAVSVNVPDYRELTKHTTGEGAGRFMPFKNEELIALASMLEEFPQGMRHTPGLHYLVRRLDGTPHPLYPAAGAVAWTQSGYIEFMESAFKEAGAAFIHRLILHEKAHFLWEHLFDEQLKQDWIELGGWYRNPAAAGKAVAALDAPPSPTNLRFSALTDSSCRVRWDASERATDYDVNYKELGGKWTNEPHKGTRLYNTIYGLEPNTEYRWAARAENRDGASEWVFGPNFTTNSDSNSAGYAVSGDADGWSTTKQTEFVSAYAHGINPNEDMAESIAFYIVNPDKLRSRSPAKYEFIQNRIMHGTRYISKIREDLTFEVYNLYPDVVYPGRIIRVDIQVDGAPEADKKITIEIELHRENDFDRAQAFGIRVFSERGSYFDIGLAPIDANGNHVSAGHIFRGHHTLSKYAADGYWAPDQITLRDAQGNERHESQTDFGWKLYVDNPLADDEAPVYIKNSMRLSLSEGAEAGRPYQIVTARWKLFEKNGVNYVHALMNDPSLATYSRILTGDYGFYNPATSEARVELVIPDYFPSGTYELNRIAMQDIALNDSGVYFTHPGHGLYDTDRVIDELPATIEVQTANPDTIPPELDVNRITIEAEPTNPAAPNGETRVDITFRVKDNISGYKDTAILLRDPQGVEHYFVHQDPDAYQIYFSRDPTVYETYKKTIILPVGSIPGIWGLAGMTVSDKAENTLRADFTETVRFEVDSASAKPVALADRPQLQQNAPNPFNSQTIIPYFLHEPGTARLEVFALTGQRVAVLNEGPQPAGHYRLHWNGRDRAGRPLASGTYLYRLVTAEGVLTRKLTLLR